MKIDGVEVTVKNLPDATVDELKHYVDYVRQKTNGRLMELTVNPSEEEEDSVVLRWIVQGEKFERIRCITGYLVGTIDRWNNAKRAEEKERVKYDYKETERRLFRYPELKKNIEEYRADIEDIKREDLEKSKDIVKFSINGGNTPQEDIEEKRQKLIANLESRIASDLYEIRQIDRALERVKGDEHFPIIEAYYFEKCDTEKLEGQFHYSERTIRRYRKNLVNIISDALYGAEE